ncbi:MAG TPA: M48 family metalloprotease [Steroidobacteraceae bacterium]|nr:M48 family metalloprotease [Steroidobacteraceae bacterium]
MRDVPVETRRKPSTQAAQLHNPGPALARFRATLASLLAAASLTVLGLAASAGPGDDLPDIGTPADTALSQNDEYQIGLMVIKGLRDAGQILEDPEATEYLQSIGSRLATHATEGHVPFQFFVVKDHTINAFALPGGFVCVNSGLILATANESELAGVMAHEIAHVTQRHIARGIRAQSKSGMASAAALLAAILIGAATGSADAAQAGIVLAQGAAAQQQLNFSRAAEYEADRVGITYMGAAGFDARAMPAFFDTLNRKSGGPGRVPEFLQDHPVTSNRIAEAKNRADQMPKIKATDSVSFALVRERLRVFALDDGGDPVESYRRAAISANAPGDSRQYGDALARIEGGHADTATVELAQLIQQHDDVILYRSAYGQALAKSGDVPGALRSFETAMGLFPRNVPLTVRYAETLLGAGQADKAHHVLLDLFNVVPPTPDQIRLTALAANSAGDVADAYFYMSEYHIVGGDLALAASQLQMALAVPGLTQIQRARFQARLEQIREVLPKNQRVNYGEPSPPPQEPAPGSGPG